MEIGLLVIILIELVCIICLISYLVYFKRKNPSKDTSGDAMAEVERLKLYSDFDFDKIDDRIDKYIQEAGDEYKLNNFEYKEPEDVYLREDDMNDMIKFMIKDVRKRITPAILDLIKLSYNINSEDDLIELLYERVRMYVLSYSIEVNAAVE